MPGIKLESAACKTLQSILVSHPQSISFEIFRIVHSKLSVKDVVLFEYSMIIRILALSLFSVRTT